MTHGTNELITATATGLQLVQRLNGLIGGFLQGSIPASIGRRIGVALDDADSRLARRAALERATAILDGNEGLSRWALAQRLESALERFGAVGYGRVKAGYREPDELERHLMTLLETGGPRCSSKLWEELRAFDLPKSETQ